MTCPTCGSTNRDGAAFCRNCGRLLSTACPRCGSAAGPEANFCDTCGAPLSPQAWIGSWSLAGGMPAPLQRSLTPVHQPPGAPMEPDRDAVPLDRFIPRELLAKLTAARGAVAERRVVTMLFCDVQGSTALAEQLDPEEWTEIINGAFEQMVRPIYRYEGTVARLMGDGLLAFFGAPIAHEDDPRRAILAGLDIVEGIRAWRDLTPAARELDVRVGINTGLVVVGAVGSDLRLEYSAIGDAINLAARMEQSAMPGTVQVAEDTHRLVAGQFEVEPLGGVAVKGKTQPVAAYRIVRRAGSQARRDPAALRAPLVNRRMEWEALERVFETLGAGRGSILFLTGDAGLGKTRLIDEAIERILPAMPDARLFESSAVSYETNQPYGLVTRLMRQPLGLMSGDPPALVRERLAATANPEDLPILQNLFGVATAGNIHEISGEMFAGQLDAALERFWRAQAAGGPLVLALDELQWIDASSAARLAALFHLTENIPALFLCAMRRERRSPGWGLKESAGRDLPHRLLEVALHPLNDGESRQMLTRLLETVQPAGGTEIPDSLSTLILEKAEGNPLFLEEVVRHLIERGLLDREDGRWPDEFAAGISLPDSLLAMLTARIDRLDEATRRTLQAAAVIGRQFPRSILDSLVDQDRELDRHLVELQRMELVREVSRLPEPVYSFNHSLTQEAVYNTILLKQRRAMHLRVAETIAVRSAAPAVDAAPVLAHHFLEAEEPVRALPYLLSAAAGALHLHAVTEALTHYHRALPIALTLPDRNDALIEIYTNRGRALELQSRFAEAKAIYEEFEHLALTRGDRVLELESIILQGKLFANVTPFYDAQHGRELMERAMALAEETGNRVAETRILWNLLNSHRFDLNSLDRAIAYGERGLALARELALDEELAYLLNDLGDIYGTYGDFVRAFALLSEAGDKWRDLGNEAMLADSLSSAAVWESIRGNLGGSLAMAAEAMEITARINNPWGQAYSNAVHGQILGQRGDVGQGIVEISRGIEKARGAGFMGGQLIALSFLSRLRLEAGDIESAMTLAREGVNIGRDYLPQFAGMCIGRLALAHIAHGELDAAAEVLADPLAHEEQQQVFVKFDIIMASLELSLAKGEPHEALQLADTLIPLLSRSKAGIWLPFTLHTRARALIDLGYLDEAADVISTSVAEARAIDLRLGVWRLLDTWAGLEEQRGNHDTAAGLLAEAESEINYLAERTFPDDLRWMFLGQADVTRILEGRFAGSNEPAR